MHFLVITIAFLVFAVLAPLHVTLVTCVILILIPTIVRYAAKTLAGTEPTFDEAFKAVALSLFFVGLSALMLGSAMGGINATGSVVFVLLAGFFTAYVLGFKVSLGTSFVASAAIASVSAVVSVLALWLLRSAF